MDLLKVCVGGDYIAGKRNKQQIWCGCLDKFVGNMVFWSHFILVCFSCVVNLVNLVIQASFCNMLVWKCELWKGLFRFYSVWCFYGVCRTKPQEELKSPQSWGKCYLVWWVAMVFSAVDLNCETSCTCTGSLYVNRWPSVLLLNLLHLYFTHDG